VFECVCVRVCVCVLGPGRCLLRIKMMKFLLWVKKAKTLVSVLALIACKVKLVVNVYRMLVTNALCSSTIATDVCIRLCVSPKNTLQINEYYYMRSQNQKNVLQSM